MEVFLTALLHLLLIGCCGRWSECCTNLHLFIHLLGILYPLHVPCTAVEHCLRPKFYRHCTFISWNVCRTLPCVVTLQIPQDFTRGACFAVKTYFCLLGAAYKLYDLRRCRAQHCCRYVCVPNCVMCSPMLGFYFWSISYRCLHRIFDAR